MTTALAKPKATSEKELHNNLAAFLLVAQQLYPALHYCKHCPNESSGTGPRKTIMSKGRAVSVPLDVLANAKRGVVAGVWDWELLYPNAAALDGQRACYWRGIAIEIKTYKAYRTKDNGLSDDQLEWQKHYKANLWRTLVFCDWRAAAVYLVRWVGGDVRRFEGLL